MYQCLEDLQAIHMDKLSDVPPQSTQCGFECPSRSNHFARVPELQATGSTSTNMNNNKNNRQTFCNDNNNQIGINSDHCIF